MVLAARTGAWSKSGGWVNPYVTDGLVAMWDGEWNAGGGLHDPNATVWKDLVGNAYATLHGVEFSDKYIEFGTSDKYCTIDDGSASVFNEPDGHLEIVFLNNVTSAESLMKTPYFLGCGFQQGYGWHFSSLSNKGFDLPSKNRIHSASVPFGNKVPTALYLNLEAWGRSGMLDSMGGSQTYTTFGKRIGTRDHYNGRIYCLRFYKNNLTQSQIASNYAIDKARFNLP